MKEKQDPEGITLERMGAPPGAQIVRLSDLLDEWVQSTKALYEARQSGKPLGPITGLPGVDKALGGAFYPGLNIVHAAPCIGKSAFCLQIACDCKCPALYILCEMDTLELFRRIISRVTKTDIRHLSSGEVPPEYARALACQAITAAPDLWILDGTREPLTSQAILEHAKAVRSSSDAEHLLIVMDSVHSWIDGLATGSSEYEALNAGLTDLRTIASTLKCPVIGIAERNRQSLTRGGIASSAGSRKFEYGAESVIELNADEESTGEEMKALTLVLSKNRHGHTGTQIPLIFEPHIQSFKELAYGMPRT
ncbi:MAG: DnaB-like helicase C-terminal domain-containing protein [Armatimonadota bacterium]